MENEKAAPKGRLFRKLSPRVLQQRVNHADQHTDNQQRGGIKSEIVHGVLSFVFCSMPIRRRGMEKVPGKKKKFLLTFLRHYAIIIKRRRAEVPKRPKGLPC